MKLHTYWLLFVFLAAAQGSTAQDWAQTNNVRGTVCTMSGQPLGGALVQIRRLGQTIAATWSNGDGSFVLSNLPAGQYEVVATSGLVEAHQLVDLHYGDGLVMLRVPYVPRAAKTIGGQATVSVAQLKIPRAAQKYFQKAQHSLSRGRIEEARQQVDKALEAFPASAAALALRAVIQLQQDQPEPARQDAENAIAFDPEYGMGYIVLGAVYNQLSRFDDAVRALNQGMSLQPSAWQAHLEMSRAMLGKGDYRAALQQADQAWNLCPIKFPPILLVRAYAQLGMRDHVAAATALEQYLQSDPKGSGVTQVRRTLDQVRNILAGGGSQ